MIMSMGAEKASNKIQPPPAPLIQSEVISQKAKTSIVYYSKYMKSRKMVLMNPVENGLADTVGEGEGGTNLRKEH